MNSLPIDKKKVPEYVSRVTETLEKAGFEAYIVGGCVRDMFLNREPKDWDVTTNATPEEIIALFPKTFYENTYGTVGVVFEDLVSHETSGGEVKKEGEDIENGTRETPIVEVTPYRIEEGYSNNRHPDKVVFSKNLTDDLHRRDFTVNAIAIRFLKDTFEIVDPYKGQEDIKDKVLRAVGEAEKRFGEDALRILRGIRLSSQLGFEIEGNTLLAMQKCGPLLAHISAERIRDEFSKILMSPEPARGLELARNLGILDFVSSEFQKGVGCAQNQAHSFDVWTHLLKTVQHAADKEYPLEIRLAALFHDIGKPDSKRVSRETGQPTFYGHEVIGAKITKKILEDLKYPTKTIEKVVKLVRWHMFFSDTELITISAVRRMIVNVGQENIWDLMNIRICDRIGTGRPKEDPYRLRKYHAMIEEALRDPISVAMLKIDGGRIMEILAIPPSKKIGFILHALLEDVLNDPTKNTPEYLENRTKELNLLDEKVLADMAEEGKEKKEQAEEEEKAKIASKFRVK